jgi:GntR family transcriptional regulator, vanillate catabolism transcriptional regulator
MILRGVLRPGERLVETDLAERLAQSRTPIRQALPALAQEGLLIPAGARGYRVREFTRQESLQALHLRALLEGFAARSLAMAGKGRDVAALLRPLLDEGDRILSGVELDDRLEEDFGRMNSQFHETVVRSTGDALLCDLVARCNVVPFTSPGSIAFENYGDAEILDMLRYAHRQHHAIVEALNDGDALRVEMLFREHATTQEHSMAMRSDASDRSTSSAR